MKAIITGMNGTVAPYIYEELIRLHVEVVVWDRKKTPMDTEDAVRGYIKAVQPDIFIHLATGPVEWVEYIAGATKELNIRFLYTSSVSVFSENGTGPYTVQSLPDAEDDYGRYKIECEQAARANNPQVIILRLGWQIGESTESNHMVAFLTKSYEENGFIEASSKWYPSCSFLEDTAASVVDAALNHPPSTYLLNANMNCSFFDIAHHLKKKHAAPWEIREITTFVRDDRMIDDRIRIKQLEC